MFLSRFGLKNIMKLYFYYLFFCFVKITNESMILLYFSTHNTTKTYLQKNKQINKKLTTTIHKEMKEK